MKGPSAQLLVVSPDKTVVRVVYQCAISLGHMPITARTLPQAKRSLIRSRIDLLCLDSVLPVPEVEAFWRWVATAAGDCAPQLLLLAPSSAKLMPASLPAFFRPERHGLVSKPLDGEEVARELTRALASDDRPKRAPDLMRAGPLTLDAASHELYFGSNTTVSLTPTEFRLIRYLIEHSGEFVGVNELLEEVWGYAPDTGGAEVIRSHVNNVRRKIDAAGEDPHVLRNVPYRGYGILAAHEANSRS
ncbi:MAG: winged helix-turn-helix domain-containing protein [Dehalococcoidia bacterium]